MPKIFIISLPRTGTTSACLFFLEHGLNVAHTAFSDKVIEQADTIADTPVYVDYKLLSKRYPKAKFIYLKRPLDEWIPSIRRLLKSMRKRWLREGDLFNFEIQRCFELSFPNFLNTPNFSDSYLLNCANQHRNRMLNFFAENKKNLLEISIYDNALEEKLLDFCGLSIPASSKKFTFPHVNKGTRITYWNDIVHPNKIN